MHDLETIIKRNQEAAQAAEQQGEQLPEQKLFFDMTEASRFFAHLQHGGEEVENEAVVNMIQKMVDNGCLKTFFALSTTAMELIRAGIINLPESEQPKKPSLIIVPGGRT